MENITIYSETLTAKSDPVPSRRLRYEDIYSSSSDESNGSATAKSSKEVPLYEINDPEIGIGVVTPMEILAGSFALVRLLSSKGNEFRYVVVCQSSVKENGEVDVAFLKMYGTEKRLFRIIEGDERIVPAQDILQVLDEPKMKTTGDRLVYELKRKLLFLRNKAYYMFIVGLISLKGNVLVFNKVK